MSSTHPYPATLQRTCIFSRQRRPCLPLRHQAAYVPEAQGWAGVPSRIRRPENSGRGCFEAGSSRKITIFAVCRESIPSDFHPEKCSRKKFVGFWVVSNVQIGIESAQILFSSPLAEAPPQTSTSPALFGVRSMHIANPYLDNPPSTCDGLLQTHQKQPIWSPLPASASPRASLASASNASKA